MGGNAIHFLTLKKEEECDQSFCQNSPRPILAAMRGCDDVAFPRKREAPARSQGALLGYTFSTEGMIMGCTTCEK